MTDPRRAGRHEAPGQPPFRLATWGGGLVGPSIFVVGLVGGLTAAAWHWLVNTALLGARLPTAVHVLLVGVFFVVVLTVAVVASRLGYQGVARRSEARRRQWRDEWL